MDKVSKKDIIIAVLVLLLIVSFGYIIWQNGRNGDEPQSKQVAAAEDPHIEEEKVIPDGIQIPGYPQLTADHESGAIQVYFENPEGNPCYFQIDLILEETGETVYKSEMFKPGTGIEAPKLDTIPSPGVYKATIVYNTQSLSDNTAMNGAVIQTKLMVQ